jgi:hypothetical protein
MTAEARSSETKLLLATASTSFMRLEQKFVDILPK